MEVIRPAVFPVFLSFPWSVSPFSSPQGHSWLCEGRHASFLYVSSVFTPCLVKKCTGCRRKWFIQLYNVFHYRSTQRLTTFFLACTDQNYLKLRQQIVYTGTRNLASCAIPVIVRIFTTKKHTIY